MKTIHCMACGLGILLSAAHGFSQDIPHKQMERACDECHATADWNTIHFDHGTTPFPLDGGHRAVSCIHCHRLEDFKLEKTDCRACHLDVHQGKLPYSCERCHSAKGWTVIDIFRVHANTPFPIIGAHSKVDCYACHRTEILGEFARIQSDCYACHEQDYRNAKNPVHGDFGFGRRCEDCHAMIAWRPATFKDHESRFPISSGTHASAWQSCQDCHINPGDYRAFSCINCHEHSAGSTIGRHDEVRGFTYEPTSCYRCHPRGKGEGD